MSDAERYTSQAILREDTLYYDMGYRYSSDNGKKPNKAFNKDYTLLLLLTTFLIQSLVGVAQLFTLIGLLFLFILRYVATEKAKSPMWMLLIIAGHVYDYREGKIIAQPGKLIQDQLTTMFWILEITWVIVLAYQFLIIFQPFTPLIAKDQTVKPETIEARKNYQKMLDRLEGTDYEVQTLTKLIDIDKLQQTLIGLIKIVAIILTSSIILDMLIWRIIFSLGGGTNVDEQYVITGMSLILFVILVAFSNLISPDEEKEE